MEKKLFFQQAKRDLIELKIQGYPNQTIDYLLENYNINPNDIDIVTCGAWNYPDYDVLCDYFDKFNQSREPWNRLLLFLKNRS